MMQSLSIAKDSALMRLNNLQQDFTNTCFVCHAQLFYDIVNALMFYNIFSLQRYLSSLSRIPMYPISIFDHFPLIFTRKMQEIRNFLRSIRRLHSIKRAIQFAAPSVNFIA